MDSIRRRFPVREKVPPMILHKIVADRLVFKLTGMVQRAASQMTPTMETKMPTEDFFPEKILKRKSLRAEQARQQKAKNIPILK
jgi:hypothetical protein